MTETPVNAETETPGLGGLFQEWVETPPPSVSVALQEGGIPVEAVEDYARSGISTDEAEALRRVLVQGAASGTPDDAALLARLTPVLDPRERAWDRVLKAKSTGETLSATVVEATRGGLVVDLGIRGFVPSSQVGLTPARNLSQYVGRTIRLRVVEVDRRRQTVVLSNRQIMEEERSAKRKAAIERIEEGQVRQGTVRRLTDIGAFVDVGGVDGLLHVSEISWNRVEHPQDALTVGQKVDVKVLRVDPEAGRISLSMRRLVPDPWEEARRRLTLGATTQVKVKKIVPQGAVVDVEDGVEGFIPVSELAERRVNSPDEVVQVGQEVEALVLDLQPRDRRVVLSLRKLEQKRERQVVEAHQKKARASDRTTLGDVFGHLFKDLLEQEEPAPEPPAPSAPTPVPTATAAAEEAAPEQPAPVPTLTPLEAPIVADVPPVTSPQAEDAEGRQDTEADAQQPEPAAHETAIPTAVEPAQGDASVPYEEQGAPVAAADHVVHGNGQAHASTASEAEPEAHAEAAREA